MRQGRNQEGFSPLKIVIAVLTLGCLELAVYFVYLHPKDKKIENNKNYSAQKTVTEESAVANDVSTAPPVERVDDLDEAINVLNQNNPNASNGDVRQLDSEASNF